MEAKAQKLKNRPIFSYIRPTSGLFGGFCPCIFQRIIGHRLFCGKGGPIFSGQGVLQEKWHIVSVTWATHLAQRT